eukprot:12768815-Heterocapsa_arctica.AAC.1
MLQKGLASTGCVGSGESEKYKKLGSLRVITSYRKDVDELIRSHVPRDERWEKVKTKIRQLIRANGHHSLEFLNEHLKVPMEKLIREFTEYNTAVAATDHTCSIAIAALENDTVF